MKKSSATQPVLAPSRRKAIEASAPPETPKAAKAQKTRKRRVKGVKGVKGMPERSEILAEAARDGVSAAAVYMRHRRALLKQQAEARAAARTSVVSSAPLLRKPAAPLKRRPGRPAKIRAEVPAVTATAQLVPVAERRGLELPKNGRLQLMVSVAMVDGHPSVTSVSVN